ncbi:cleavage and polyadenylation specificity factor subunit 1-like [Ptychodera flava]|uniref:cleavage and polyadenylation specificity factor subunit 1-like n=1 Tax=Ptychodera flava TaxID=63121 RepID=UPI00396A0ED3
MYALYKQIHPPTGIEHCLYCNFFSKDEKNLVIAGATQLNVYRLHGDIDTSTKPSEKDVKSKKHKLEHLGSFSLFGNIMSMQSTRLAGASRDVLCLTFQDAKLSIVEYDPGTHDLKTLSMHYFEEEALKDGFVTNYQIPTVIVDPENRCAVMLIYGRKLVVLPFRREGTIDDQQENLLPGSSKSSFLPSYVINLHDIDEKLINVIDIQFLHGYYEPTLFILFEPLRTWPGRVAIRKDTYCIVAISLNIDQRVHPVIWSLTNLPFDCFKAIPVPKPIGGVLVFAVNSLIYLNQSVPPFGVSLNGLTDGSTQFPLKIHEGVKISLDCAQAAFVMYDRLVISLKGGEIYVLTVMTDGMRSVRGFHFDKAAASVLTSCIVTMEDGYLFLGSRLGNSLLLKYTEKVQDSGELAAIEPKKDEDKEKAEEEPPSKKRRTDDASDWIASDVALLADDLDELEVYGSETMTGTQLSSYTFEVCDSIMNIGPCGKAVMGEPVFLSEEFQNNADPDVELVSCSGYGKNGALSVLQRSIRPQVVTTFELPGCIDMWTVIGPPEKKDSEATESEDTTEEQGKHEQLNNSHAFLILSREDSSMILQTGQEIMELDHSGFSTQGPTVFAGNIGNNAYILQVSPMGVRLLEGVEQLQHIPLDLGSPIALCSVADPYAVIMSEKGDIVLLTLRPDGYGSGHRLAILRPQIPQKARLLTLCSYKDVSGIFTSSDHAEMTLDEVEMSEKKTKATTSTADISMTSETSNIDDEDELLYGESDATLFSPTKKEEKPSFPTKVEVEIKPTYWCAMCRENGILEIYNLPDFKLAFLVKSFPMGHRVLVDTFQVTAAASASSSSTAEQHHEMMPQVKELFLVGLGHKNKRPHLMARVDEELLIYEAFEYHQSTLDNHLRVRFKKVHHDILAREKKFGKSKKQTKASQADAEDDGSEVKRLRYFEDVSGYSGVFVCGPYPHWLFMTARGILRAHPMYIDGSVICFAPFHNVNCPKGFLYFNKHGELRICVLPTHLSYDAHWPVRKVPLRCTPHFISYHIESKTYAVVTSVAEPCNRVCKMTGDEKEFEEVERGERFIFPTIERFSLQLFSPLSWEAIPQTKIEMEDWEHITDLKTVSLKSEGTVSGLKGYVAISTTIVYGEEVSCRGRILIFDVIEVVPEPGQPLTKNKFKMLYSKEQKGPVTALAEVEGFLASAVGQKIYIWAFRNSDLVGIAFIDSQIFIHQLSSIKNFILVADIKKSIALLNYSLEHRTLSLVSKDTKPLEVYACEYMVDDTQLAFLVSDADKNLILYHYQPEARESFGGMRLLRRADINIGSHVTTFFRLRSKLSDPATEKILSGYMERRHTTMFATLDGSIAFLQPMTEKTYRRLLMLQNALIVQIPHTAGLNPKAFRIVRHHYRELQNPLKNILDGDLLWKYTSLSVQEKSDLAKKIGTSVDQILNDLMDVERYTAHF